MTPLLEVCAATIQGRLRPTSLSAQAGQLIALIGPNGSGKTSLLRAIAGIEQDGGSVSIDGEIVAEAGPARRGHLLSFLPASREVVWPIKAADVIALGTLGNQAGRVADLIAALELQGFADRPVNSLSTGERARVLLARALAPRPRMLLLDEPLSNLDIYWVLRTLEILRATVLVERCSALVAVHDLNQVKAFDRVIVMEGGQVVAAGLPDEVLGSRVLMETFGVEPTGQGWAITPAAGPQSSR